MAYAHPFKYDVFMSYASADTRDRGKDWLTETHGKITRVLSQFETFGVKGHYLDTERPLENLPLDSVIRQAARNSAVFIAFVSENYLRSTQWCLRELEAWGEHRDTGEAEGNLFLVSLDGTTDKALSGRFPWLESWKFWRCFDNHGTTLKLESGTSQDGHSLDQLAEIIASAVGKRIREIRLKKRAPRIYLAETSRGAADEKWPEATTDELEKHFEGEGIIVERDRLPLEQKYEAAKLRIMDKIAGCDLFFQRLEPSEDNSPGGGPTWQQLQREIFASVPLNAAHPTVPLFWLPRGTDPPASWRQGFGGVEPETRTLEDVKRSAVSRARAEDRRRKIKGGLRSPATPDSAAPARCDLLIVSTPPDFDYCQKILSWMEENNKTLRKEFNQEVSYSAIIDNNPLVEFEELNGTVIDPRDKSLICRSVMQVHGYCSEDDINRRQSHWYSLVHSPGAAIHRSTLRDIYTAEFDPPPKTRRSAHIRHHQGVRIDQAELMRIMQTFITP